MARFRSIDLLHIILCTQSSNSSTALCPLCELRWIISFPRVRRSTRSQRVPADPWLVQTLNKQLAFICLQQIIINLGHPTAQRVVWKPSFIFMQQQLFHLCSKVPWLKEEKTLHFQNEPPKKNEERPFESSFIEFHLYRPKRFLSSKTFLEFNQTPQLKPQELESFCRKGYIPPVYDAYAASQQEQRFFFWVKESDGNFRFFEFDFRHEAHGTDLQCLA